MVQNQNLLFMAGVRRQGNNTQRQLTAAKTAACVDCGPTRLFCTTTELASLSSGSCGPNGFTSRDTVMYAMSGIDYEGNRLSLSVSWFDTDDYATIF